MGKQDSERVRKREVKIVREHGKGEDLSVRICQPRASPLSFSLSVCVSLKCLVAIPLATKTIDHDTGHWSHDSILCHSMFPMLATKKQTKNKRGTLLRGRTDAEKKKTTFLATEKCNECLLLRLGVCVLELRRWG